jgi:hypothetical protein
MRIISQNGTIDMPYEEVIIQRFKSRIYFLNKNLTGVESLSDDMQIAEYSTEEKAIKAMEMLREVYAGMPIVIQNVNTPKGTLKTLEVVQGCGTSNIVFQFPQDDEIEV